MRRRLTCPGKGIPFGHVDLLDELDSLLTQSDAAAVGLFKDHAAALRAALGAPCDELARQIGKFDLDAARETLRALRQ